MALTTPDTASEIIDRAVNDVELALAQFGADPALPNSWLNTLIRAYCLRIFDFYETLDIAATEAIPDTAVELLDRWAAIFGVTRVAGSQSGGNTIATGTVGKGIGAGATLADGAGKIYTVDAAVTISTKSNAAAASGLTDNLDGTATFEMTPTKHELADNVLVTITGAAESEYNVGPVACTIISDTAFTFPISGSPASPDGGSPLAGYDTATLAVTSEGFGDTEDQLANAVLKFQSPIVGVDDTTQVDFDAIGGGADQELDVDLRARLLDRIQNPIAHFNVAEITAVAKTVAGVTRVFVQEITPAVGQVTVYFMRDNDADPIPSGAEVSDVNTVLQAIRPANTDEADLIVAAPTALSEDFTFSAIVPDTASLRAAITASLEQFFAERTEVEVTVDEDAYRSAIFNTVDTTNGDELTSFTLSTPSGDLTAPTAGDIVTLGTVSFT
jgi:uncharacterized phage protein gp47/JayE